MLVLISHVEGITPDFSVSTDILHRYVYDNCGQCFSLFRANIPSNTLKL